MNGDEVEQIVREVRQAHLNVNRGREVSTNLATSGGIAALDIVLNEIARRRQEAGA